MTEETPKKPPITLGGILLIAFVIAAGFWVGGVVPLWVPAIPAVIYVVHFAVRFYRRVTQRPS